MYTNPGGFLRWGSDPRAKIWIRTLLTFFPSVLIQDKGSGRLLLYRRILSLMQERTYAALGIEVFLRAHKSGVPLSSFYLHPSSRICISPTVQGGDINTYDCWHVAQSGGKMPTTLIHHQCRIMTITFSYPLLYLHNQNIFFMDGVFSVYCSAVLKPIRTTLYTIHSLTVL